MNIEEIKELIIQTEKNASLKFDSYIGKHTVSPRISRIRALKKPGDIFNYTHAENQSERDVAYERLGIKTCRDTVDELVSSGELDISDVTRVDDLNIGDTVSTLDICAMARSWNLMQGMYSCIDDRTNRPYVIVKSEVHERSPYQDRWLDAEEVSYYYCAEKETARNRESFHFAKPGNKAIFNDIMSGPSEDPLPIHLFVQSRKGEPFKYCGVFYALEMLDDYKAFKLVFNRVQNNAVFAKERNTFYKKLEHDLDPEFVAKSKKLKEKRLLESENDNPFDNERFNPDFVSRDEVVDYIKKQYNDILVGNIGEKMAIEFEKERVSKLNIDPDMVQFAADKCGYDIRSFDLVDGNIVPVCVEVKTTSSPNPRRAFHVTKNERNAMDYFGKKYYLYRIYDIFSDEPKMLALKGDIRNKTYQSPTDYVFSIK